MRHVGVLALVSALAACEPPQPTLDLQLSSGPAQECPSTDCEDIGMPCQMFMSVRILSPDDASAPLHTECLPIPTTREGAARPAISAATKPAILAVARARSAMS